METQKYRNAENDGTKARRHEGTSPPSPPLSKGGPGGVAIAIRHSTFDIRCWLAQVGIAVFLVGNLAVGCRKSAVEPATASEAESATPAHVKHTPDGEVAVTINAGTQDRIGLTIETLAAATHRPECVAYGMFEEDPSQVFTLRAPTAGVLRVSDSGGWPEIGAHLAEGAAVGWIEPRMGPIEQVDLATRIAQARAEAEQAAASLSAARVSYENKKALNADNKVVSDRVLEDSEAKVKNEEARYRAATETVALVEACQAGGEGMARPTLRVAQAGEAIAIHVRPGEAVEAGQVLLRVARFDQMLARVQLPVGESIDLTSPRARVVPVGFEQLSLPGERIAQVSAADSRPQGVTFLLRVAQGDAPVRPGTAVLAYLPAPGGEKTGVVIPRAAVVRTAGKAWTYLQTSDDTFLRREIPANNPTNNGWFVSSGFAAGDRIVVEGAFALLSEELKPSIAQEAVAEEQ